MYYVEFVKLSKEQIYFIILNTALKLDSDKGHLRWTLTELARISCISRSLIYYYFGSSKILILTTAIEMISDDVIGLSRNKFKNELGFSVLKVKELFTDNPHLIYFYMKWKNTSSELGQLIRRQEFKFKEKIKNSFPHLDERKQELIYLLVIGALFSNELNQCSFKQVLSEMQL